MSGEREAFGARLRRERERRCITLESIAEATKIKRSLLADLERGDVSRWPHGIFRRSFVRDYAAAIGLDRAETLATFLALFPDPGEEAPARATPPGAPATGVVTPMPAAAPAPASTPPGSTAPSGAVVTASESDLRLTLAVDASTPVRGVPARIVAALAEVAIVVLVAGIAALVDMAAFSTAAVTAALAWSIGSTLVWGRNPVLAWLETDGRSLSSVAPARPAFDESRAAAIAVAGRDAYKDEQPDHHVSDRFVRVRPIRPVTQARVVPQRREDARQRARRSRA